MGLYILIETIAIRSFIFTFRDWHNKLPECYEETGYPLDTNFNVSSGPQLKALSSCTNSINFLTTKWHLVIIHQSLSYYRYFFVLFSF